MKTSYKYLTVSAVSLAIFLLIAMITTGTQGVLIDEAVAYWVQGASTVFVVGVMQIISILGSTEVVMLLTLLFLVLLFMKSDWFHLIFFALVSAGGIVVNFLVKLLFHRERPGGEVKNVELFNFSFELPSYSFPSGHTMRVTILFMFIMYMSFLLLKTTVLKFVSYVLSISLLLLVAMSRLFLDAHFFTDVIGSLFLGVSWFYLVLFIFKWRKESKNETRLTF